LHIIELPLNMKITQLNFTWVIFTSNLTILRGESRRNYKYKIFFQIRTTLLLSCNSKRCSNNGNDASVFDAEKEIADEYNIFQSLVHKPYIYMHQESILQTQYFPRVWRSTAYTSEYDIDRYFSLVTGAFLVKHHALLNAI